MGGIALMSDFLLRTVRNSPLLVGRIRATDSGRAEARATSPGALSGSLPLEGFCGRDSARTSLKEDALETSQLKTKRMPQCRELPG